MRIVLFKNEQRLGKQFLASISSVASFTFDWNISALTV